MANSLGTILFLLLHLLFLTVPTQAGLKTETASQHGTSEGACVIFKGRGYYCDVTLPSEKETGPILYGEPQNMDPVLFPGF